MILTNECGIPSLTDDLDQDEAKNMYLTTKMDLMSIAKSWDEKEGPEKLRSMLDEKKLTPLLA